MSPLGLKSGKKAKEAKAAAPAKAAKPAAPKAAATKGVLVEKPKANIYTVLLVLSFVAILIGCLALYLELKVYDFDMKARI